MRGLTRPSGRRRRRAHRARGLSPRGTVASPRRAARDRLPPSAQRLPAVGVARRAGIGPGERGGGAGCARDATHSAREAGRRRRSRAPSQGGGGGLGAPRRGARAGRRRARVGRGSPTGRARRRRRPWRGGGGGGGEFSVEIFAGPRAEPSEVAALEGGTKGRSRIRRRGARAPVVTPVALPAAPAARRRLGAAAATGGAPPST